MCKQIVILILYVIIEQSTCLNDLYVRVNEGVLKGRYIQTQNGRTVRAFTGVRFAKPPINELRFKPAEPLEPWKGVKNATEPHTECLQLEKSNLLGDEDCLFLNVYTPKKQNKKFPVIFYIFGGSLYFGSADITWYRPDYLLNQNIVLVLANYRLGSMGFLTTGDNVLPGNLGLKDQTLALRWVKENIEAFGGNSKSVTIAGNSAGAVCAHLHMFSPLSKGLFKKAILNSGSAFSPVFRNYVQHSQNIAKLFNCPTTNSTLMLECIRQIDPKELIRKEPNAAVKGTDIVFGPVIDSYAPGAFMPLHPMDAIKTGKTADVPIMTGLTSNEGINMALKYWIAPEIMTGFKTDFNNMLSILLSYNEHKNKHIISSKIKEFYFKNQEINNSSLASVGKMYGDRTFEHPIRTTIKLQMEYLTNDIYCYFFAFRGSKSSSELINGDTTNYGVAHSDELLYIFNLTHKYPNHKPSQEDIRMIKIMTGIWANFALHGNPNSKSTQRYAKWLPVSRPFKKLNFLHFRTLNNITMDSDIHEDRIQFWDNLNI